MLVTITKQHCIGADFYDIIGCPLFRALEESGLKDFRVTGSWVREVRGFGVDILHYFKANGKDWDPSEGWNIIRMLEIMDGKIESYTLDIPTLELNQQSQLI